MARRGMEAKLPVRVLRVFRGLPFYWESWGLTAKSAKTEAGAPVCDRLKLHAVFGDKAPGLTRRRGDAERKQRGNFISAQRWVQPDVQTAGNHAKTLRRKDKEMNQNVISDQFWGEPEAGRNGVLNGCPDKNLCVFASWREDKTSNNGNSRGDAETRRWGKSPFYSTKRYSIT